MTIKSINVVKKIAQRITSANENNLVVLFNNINPVSSIPSDSIISVNGFLKNLKAYSRITSTLEVPLPNIQITDSDQERLFATLDIEWKSQRKHLDLLVSADGNDYIEIGTISLIRQQGYPYRMHSLLDFFTDGLADEFGDNGKVAVKISDVGYGLLSGDDTVTIHGSYLQEIVYDEALIANPISNQMQINSINPPPNPQLGATWNEVDIGNNFIQQWNYFNNGWQSHEKTFTASSAEIVDNNIFGCFHINPKYKYLISIINFIFSPNSNLDFNNYYQLQIYQSKDNKTLQAEVLGADFNNHIANTIYSNVYEANLLHSPFLPGEGDLVLNDGTNSTQGFIWSLSRFGTSTIKIAYSLEINYRLIRR